MRRFLLLGCAVAVAIGSSAAPALACPSCGIGDRFGGWGFVVFAAFIATPFFLTYGVYRYIKNLTRQG
jgi:hypothetical protein